MAQTQQNLSVEEMMRQHRAEDLKRHGISEQQPERSSDHKPTMGVKAPVAQAMEAAVQQCDSIVNYTAYGTPNYKQEFSYDTDGHRTARLESWWNGDGWEVNNKSEYTYDINGYQNGEIFYAYQSEFGTWLESYRYEYAYDEQGHQLNYISYYWNGEAWVASYKNEYTYDANGYQSGYASYDYINDKWVGSSKSEYSYDDNGRQTSYAYYYWSDGAWYGNWKSEYTYDEFGHQTSYTSYNWVDGAWVGNYKTEYAFDAEGYELGYNSYYYQNGEWVLSNSYKNEYTFDDNGLPASFIRYYTWDGITWSIDYKREFTYDANGNKLSEIDYWWSSYYESWQMNDKHDYTYDAHGNQLSDYYYTWGGSDWYLQNTTDMAYDNFGNQTSYISYGWRNGQWTGMDRNEHSYDESGRSLSNTYYSWYEGEWFIISMSEYAYDANGNETSNASSYACDSYNGPVTLKLNLSNDPLADCIDQQDLLFTGQGYKVNALYVDEYVGEKPLEEVTIWENQGYGEINWNGLYRFSNESHMTGEEIYAFSMEDWNIIKEGTVRVDLEFLTDWPNIRITTGWWSATYGGEEHNCLDLVQTDEDGNKYILLNIKEDGNLYENLDSQHLLFTGDNYNLLRIRVKRTNPEDWEHRCIWQNNGDDFVNWSGTYRFGQEGHEGDCIATFNATDWDLIKKGYLTAEIETNNPNELMIYVTSGWWSTMFTGNYIQFGSNLLSGKIVPVLTGNSKEETTYDEQGNITSRSVYRWNWDEKTWELSFTEIYYYSTNDVTDLDEILTGARSRLSKEMRDGKVFIVVGDKTYTLDGQLVK